MSKNVLSIESFAEWCEAQGDREYNWASVYECAITQYASFLGNEDLYEVISDLPCSYGDAEGAAFTFPHTFSALASRLRSSGGQTDG